MGFIMDRPGLTLIVAGILAYVLRPAVRWVPLVGGAISAMLLLASVFFLVDGIWMIVVGRSPDPT